MKDLSILRNTFGVWRENSKEKLMVFKSKYEKNGSNPLGGIL